MLESAAGERKMFKSVKHALQIAYLMEFVQMYAKSCLAHLIDKAMEKYGIEPEEESSVFWERLDQSEIKAQCAMIRNVCQRVLTPDEYTYVMAKYSQEPGEIDKDGLLTLDGKIPARNRFQDSVEGGLLCVEKTNCVCQMIQHVLDYGTPSERTIARENDETLYKVRTDIGRIRRRAKGLEFDIERKLAPLFRKEGVV